MNNNSTSQISDELDDYPEITQEDLDRAVYRIGRKPAQRQQRVPILLDAGIVAYYMGIAGEGGYQSLINDTLREAVIGQNLEDKLRRIVREEIQSAI